MKCEECGRSFIPSRCHPYQRFCSRTCSIGAWIKANPERSKENARRRWRDNPQKRAYHREWKKAHKPYVRSAWRKWMANHPEITKKRNARRDPVEALLRSRVNAALRGNRKGGHYLELIGCTAVFLRNHLESLFLPGMTWENRGVHGWHVDHVVPLSWFPMHDPEWQKVAFHFSNLQPLWATQNRKKGNRYADRAA